MAAFAVSATATVAALGVLADQDMNPTPVEADPASKPNPAVVPESTASPTPTVTSPRTITAEPVTVPNSGSGKFSVAPVIAEPGSRSTITYTVEVETGLPFTAAQFARTVELTLDDKRGWTAKSTATFAQVDGGANTRIVLATPTTVDRLCAPLQTRGGLSCRNGPLVVLNAVRWAEGANTYGDDLTDYRRYLINHEVGHRLGLGHRTCPSPGSKAPVMVQQTKNLQGCEKNPWP